jgi:hypothetical protein
MASSVGLPIFDYIQSNINYVPERFFEGRISPINTPVKTVIVVKGHVVAGSVPDDILEKCRNLAELARTELLGIEFVEGPANPWTFVGATTLPDLRLGGQVLLDTLMSVLRDERGEY